MRTLRLMIAVAVLPFTALFCAAGGLCPSDQDKSLSSSDPVQEALQDIGVKRDSGLKDAHRIYRWLDRNFPTVKGGGAMVGRSTVQGILSSKKLTGCHDWGLMLSALLRAAGYRASMVDAVSVKWMKEKRVGTQKGYVGHIFVEAELDGRLVLLNSTEPSYLEDYDPASPIIPVRHYDSDLYYVLDKGADPASYAAPIRSNDDLQKRMDELASSADLEKLPGTKEVKDLPSVPGAQKIFCEADLKLPTEADKSKKGLVLQFREAGLDVFITKESDTYVVRRYPYRRVFSGSEPILFFDNMPDLRQYLRSLGSPD